jgi:hypothetical protein
LLDHVRMHVNGNAGAGMFRLATLRWLVLAKAAVVATALQCQPARAEEAGALQAGIVDGLEQMLANLHHAYGVESTSHGSVEVTGTGPQYDVVIDGINFTPKGGAAVEIARIGFGLDRVGEGIYDVRDFKVASPINEVSSSGITEPLIRTGEQTVEAIWSKQRQGLVYVTARVNDLVLPPTQAGSPVSAGSGAAYGELSDLAPGRSWVMGRVDVGNARIDGPGSSGIEAGSIQFCASGIRLETPESLLVEDGSQAADGIRRGSSCAEPISALGGPDAKARAFEAARAFAAAPVGDATAVPDVTRVLTGFAFMMEDVEAEFVVTDLSTRGNGQIWSLDRAELIFGPGEHTDEGGAARVAFRLRGLRGGMERQETSFQAFAPLVPTDLTIDLELRDAPMMGMWSAYRDYSIAVAAGQDPVAASAALNERMKRMVRESVGTVRLRESSIVADAFQVKLQGALQIDEGTPSGVTGTLAIDITGIDTTIKLLQRSAPEPHLTMLVPALELLRGFGTREMQGDIAIDHFSLSLPRSGPPQLNGKEFLSVLSTLAR